MLSNDARTCCVGEEDRKKPKGNPHCSLTTLGPEPPPRSGRPQAPSLRGLQTIAVQHCSVAATGIFVDQGEWDILPVKAAPTDKIPRFPDDYPAAVIGPAEGHLTYDSDVGGLPECT